MTARGCLTARPNRVGYGPPSDSPSATVSPEAPLPSRAGGLQRTQRPAGSHRVAWERGCRSGRAAYSAPSDRPGATASPERAAAESA